MIDRSDRVVVVNYIYIYIQSSERTGSFVS